MRADIECKEARSGMGSGRRSGDRRARAATEADPESGVPFDYVTVILEKAGRRVHTHRPCLHALAGRVATRTCTRDYRCEQCDFDRLVERTHLLYPRKGNGIVDIDGYRHSEQCHYHRGHTWTLPDYGGNVRIGLDDFAARMIGYAEAVELPALGSTILPGEPCFALRRDRHWVRVLSPIQGTVVSINEDVVRCPDLIHTDAFEKGWLVLVRPDADASVCAALVHGEEAREWMAQECGFFRVLLTRGFGGRMSVDDPERCTIVSDWAWITLVETFLHTRVTVDPRSGSRPRSESKERDEWQ